MLFNRYFVQKCANEWRCISESSNLFAWHTWRANYRSLRLNPFKLPFRKEIVLKEASEAWPARPVFRDSHFGSIR